MKKVPVVLLLALFAMMGVVVQATMDKGKKAGGMKDVHWTGTIVRRDKDASTLTVVAPPNPANTAAQHRNNRIDPSFASREPPLDHVVRCSCRSLHLRNRNWKEKDDRRNG